MPSDQIILFPGEAEQIIQSLKPMLPDNVGATEWYKQQEYINKLNLQALLSAANETDEFIKEYLIAHQKLDILIECLICIEIWKEKIFTKFVEINYNIKQNFGMYTILYHEACILNLLETVLYHADAIESLQNGILDLFDYCYRRLCQLVSYSHDVSYRVELYNIKNGISRQTEENNKNIIEICHLQELVDQEKILKYEISLKCLSILNGFVNNIKSLPLSISSRMFCTFDILVLLVDIVEKSPWMVELSNGNLYKFVENKWIQQKNWLDARNNISKLEGQVWLTIYQILFSETCRDKYELNEYRKTTILKLRSYLTNTLMDHLPILSELRKYFEQLNLIEPPNVKPSLILEQVAEFRDTILTRYEKKWETVFKSFCEYLQSATYQEDLKKQAESWSNTYNLDNIDQLISEIPKCVVCGKDAAKRCSRCKNEWYCRRECQVQHWNRHKVACDLLFNNN